MTYLSAHPLPLSRICGTGKGLVGPALAALSNALEINGQEVYKQARLAIRVPQGLGELQR